VLADLLGIHLVTALNGAAEAAGDRTNYPATCATT
jgi:hypothetical protein